jgi:hypothetical protein
MDRCRRCHALIPSFCVCHLAAEQFLTSICRETYDRPARWAETGWHSQKLGSIWCVYLPQPGCSSWRKEGEKED